MRRGRRRRLRGDASCAASFEGPFSMRLWRRAPEGAMATGHSLAAATDRPGVRPALSVACDTTRTRRDGEASGGLLLRRGLCLEAVVRKRGAQAAGSCVGRVGLLGSTRVRGPRRGMAHYSASRDAQRAGPSGVRRVSERRRRSALGEQPLAPETHTHTHRVSERERREERDARWIGAACLLPLMVRHVEFGENRDVLG